MEVHELPVDASGAGERLDRWLAAALPALSRARLQRLIETGQVLLDRQPARAAARLRPGSVVTVHIPPAEPARALPEEIPLAIVYEDHDLIVIDKPAGLVVHPAPGHPSGTLVNALLSLHPDLRVGDTIRPGIVHRLDKDTSGLLVVAKTDRALHDLQAQMVARTVIKDYLVLVEGTVTPEEATIDAPIGRDRAHRQRMEVQPRGRPARTRLAVLQRLPAHTLLRVRIETGRTHQVRVHLAYIGHPVAADPVYGRRRATVPLDRQFLHAARLVFRLPGTGEIRAFHSPLPAELREALTAAGGDPAVLKPEP